MSDLDPRNGFDICLYTYDDLTNKKNIIIEASKLDINHNSFILNQGFTIKEKLTNLYKRDENNYKLLTVYIAFPATDWQVVSNNPLINLTKGGTYELKRCTIDKVSYGIIPGRRCLIFDLKGLFESINYYNISFEEFKQTLNH